MTDKQKIIHQLERLSELVSGDLAETQDAKLADEAINFLKSSKPEAVEATRPDEPRQNASVKRMYRNPGLHLVVDSNGLSFVDVDSATINAYGLTLELERDNFLVEHLWGPKAVLVPIARDVAKEIIAVLNKPREL